MSHFDAASSVNSVNLSAELPVIEPIDWGTIVGVVIVGVLIIVTTKYIAIPLIGSVINYFNPFTNSSDLSIVNIPSDVVNISSRSLVNSNINNNKDIYLTGEGSESAWLTSADGRNFNFKFQDGELVKLELSPEDMQKSVEDCGQLFKNYVEAYQDFDSLQRYNYHASFEKLNALNASRGFTVPLEPQLSIMDTSSNTVVENSDMILDLIKTSADLL